MLVAKIRAFPDADVDWYIKHPVPEGEEGEPTNEKIDKDDAKFKDRSVQNFFCEKLDTTDNSRIFDEYQTQSA